MATLLLGAASVATPVEAAQAQVAVAANFAEPIKAIAAVLEKTTGHTLAITVGSTGKLYAQIKNGAPFDVLLAADRATPALLEQEGFAVAGTRFTYATGKLALWSADANRIDKHGKILTNPGLGKVSYANPKLAPYGAAALQVMDAMGVRAALAHKLVQGESIGQAYTFVYSGNADVGFVALSQLLEDGKFKGGSTWVVPQNLYNPIQQDAVVLKKGTGNEAALALIKLLQSPKIRDLISAYGYAI